MKHPREKKKKKEMWLFFLSKETKKKKEKQFFWKKKKRNRNLKRSFSFKIFYRHGFGKFKCFTSFFFWSANYIYDQKKKEEKWSFLF